MLKLIVKMNSYGKNEDGATAIEYGLIAAGISLAIAGAVFVFGGDLSALFAGFSGSLDGAAQ